jgi:hypothetical protein
LSLFCVLCSMLTVSLHCPFLSVLCSMKNKQNNQTKTKTKQTKTSI